MKNYTDICISLDYGTINDFCAILWMKSGETWYAVNEYYYSGRDTGVPMTDDEYGNALDRWLDKILERRFSEYKSGNKKIETIIDPSAASFIALIKKRSWCKVKKARNDVIDGIRDTASCMKNGKIKISDSMKNWIKEAQSYRWDEKKMVDSPIKELDHAMDATRYMVNTKHVNRKKNLA